MAASYSFSIFLVDDDIWYSEILDHHLSLNPENQITRFETGKQLLKNLSKTPSVIVLDYSLEDYKGDELLKKIKAVNAEIPVIIVSGQEDVSTAINLLKQGAYDYIVKNDETKDRLWSSINNLREKIELKNEITSLRKEVVRSYSSAGKLIGESKAMKNIFPLIEKSCKSNITVSITGETGTGKEVVAKSIHYNSDRKEKKFIAVNVAAIPSELIESELFGHEKGAFTGAVSRRIGKFEEANKGTLFLDEIGEMDLNMQSKLLRVLQEKEITRVGGNEIIKIDVRVIVATHKDLSEEVKKGTFREDLFYRILGLPIEIPPLRDRNQDIILIAEHLIENFCKENKLKK
ncbi:MAG: sigma-54-dependent transcriptional regulator, partial [Bacteroidia bacterium]